MALASVLSWTKSCEVGKQSISYLRAADVESNASERKYLLRVFKPTVKELALLHTSRPGYLRQVQSSDRQR